MVMHSDVVWPGKGMGCMPNGGSPCPTIQKHQQAIDDMPKFSSTSLERLNTCHPLLQELMREVILSVDCTILEGHRDEERQNALFAAGTSKVVFPESAHNSIPSNAVDVAPWLREPPHIIWPDPTSSKYALQLGQWYMFVGYVKRTAEEMGIAIRCGADWDGDWQVTDQTFHDLAHIEILSPQRA